MTAFVGNEIRCLSGFLYSYRQADSYHQLLFASSDYVCQRVTVETKQEYGEELSNTATDEQEAQERTKWCYMPWYGPCPKYTNGVSPEVRQILLLVPFSLITFLFHHLGEGSIPFVIGVFSKYTIHRFAEHPGFHICVSEVYLILPSCLRTILMLVMVRISFLLPFVRSGSSKGSPLLISFKAKGTRLCGIIGCSCT